LSICRLLGGDIRIYIRFTFTLQACILCGRCYLPVLYCASFFVVASVRCCELHLSARLHRGGEIRNLGFQEIPELPSQQPQIRSIRSSTTMETTNATAAISPETAPHDLEETIASEGSQSPPQQHHDNKESNGNSNAPHPLDDKIALEVSQSPDQQHGEKEASENSTHNLEEKIGTEGSHSPAQNHDNKEDRNGNVSRDVEEKIGTEISQLPEHPHDHKEASEKASNPLEENIALEGSDLPLASEGSHSPELQQRDHNKEDSGNASESDSASEGDSASESSDEEDNNGISEYERQRLLRIQKNEERLRQLGLLDETKKPNRSAANRKKTPRKNPNPHNAEEQPARRQPKREVKGKISEELAWLSGLTNSRPKKLKPEKKKLRCGTCVGCTREDDCNTCIYCVERITGRINPRRCIFKQCRGNDNNKKEDANDDAQQNGPQSPAKEDREHSDQCDVCANGGDLILCDTCPRGFHSNCHGKTSSLYCPFRSFYLS